MCDATVQPVKLLIIRSVTELASGNKCCSLNNGKPHVHCLKAENQRRERVHIKGKVTTRSLSKQLSFSRAGTTGSEWVVDFLAYGQRISTQQADITLTTVHSPTEDLTADLEYEYDDPFSKGYSSTSVTIPVTL
jgi:hypothetical protein